MTLAKFYSGTSSELAKKPEEDGSIYFTTDNKEIVVDIPDGERTVFSANIFDLASQEEIDTAYNDLIKPKLNVTIKVDYVTLDPIDEQEIQSELSW